MTRARNLQPNCRPIDPASAGSQVALTLTLLIAAVLLVVGALAAPSLALADEGSLDGKIRLGYRFVDVSGSDHKYREDLHLDEGARLFELKINFEPSEGQRALADRITLDLDHFGGDPFESLNLTVRKFGAYDFRFSRTTSRYFYEDVFVPIELSSPSLSDGGDFHTFDFDRVRDSAQLSWKVTPRSKLTVGFDRSTKRGDSTTTLDIQRDEFELDRPVDESSDDLRLTFEHSWPKATLVVEERILTYDNAVEIFLPGQSLGENPTNSTILDFFFLDQPYQIDSNEHTVRLNARPTDRWLIQASAVLQDLELEAEAEERSQGIGFNGQPFSTDETGGGEIERDGELFDLDVSYLINDRVALTGGVRSHSVDQKGAFDFAGEGNRGRWNIETTSGEIGIDAQVAPKVSLSVGLLTESRDVDHAKGTEGSFGPEVEESTDHTGFFARVGWVPSKNFRLDASLEDSSYDDPFTLSSPTDRQRWRLRVKAHRDNGLYFDGTLLAYRFENNDSGWDADRDSLNLRFGYRRQDLDLSFGYHLIEADRSVDQLVTTLPGFGGGQTFLFPVLYSSESDFFDARLRYRANDRVTLGGRALLYENTGTFGLERDDISCFVEVDLKEGYLVNLAYRTVDYEEEVASFDDYDADIVEVSVGYRF